MKTCCITGHRPKGFPWDYEKENHKVYLRKLRYMILKLLTYGISNFITGGAIGVDLDIAEQIISWQEMLPLPITFEVAVPCPGQDKKWEDKDKKRYANIIKKADKVTLVSESYTVACMQKRNAYMVDNSDIVLAVWNGIEKGGTWNTIKYARKINKPIEYLYLNDIISFFIADKNLL